MVGPIGNRHFYAYVSDDGNTYQIATTDVNAAAGGFGSPLLPGAFPTYPRGWKVRIAYGAAISGGGAIARTSIPIATPTLFASAGGTSFSKYGISYGINGLRGENRFNRS